MSDLTPIQRAYLYEIARARLVLQAAEERLRTLKAQSSRDWFEGLGARARRSAQRQRPLKELRISLPWSCTPPVKAARVAQDSPPASLQEAS